MNPDPMMQLEHVRSVRSLARRPKVLTKGVKVPCKKRGQDSSAVVCMLTYERRHIVRILLAIDDSTFSEAATGTVIEQARSRDTKVRVLHVVEPPPLLVAREMGGYEPALETAWEAQSQRGKTLVAKAAKRLRARGLNVTTAVEQGDPKSKILDVAEEWHADLIVLGSHGRTGLGRFLLGSISDAVARHAHCSVEIVRIRSVGND